jgi:hypothetical protein
MIDQSTVVVSNRVARRAHTNWKAEYDRCNLIYDQAIQVAKLTDGKERWWGLVPPKTIYENLKHDLYSPPIAEQLNKLDLQVPLTNWIVKVCLKRGYDEFHTNLKQLIDCGGDVTVTCYVAKFINKWKDFKAE